MGSYCSFLYQLIPIKALEAIPGPQYNDDTGPACYVTLHWALFVVLSRYSETPQAQTLSKGQITLFRSLNWVYISSCSCRYIKERLWRRRHRSILLYLHAESAIMLRNLVIESDITVESSSLHNAVEEATPGGARKDSKEHNLGCRSLGHDTATPSGSWPGKACMNVSCVKKK